MTRQQIQTGFGIAPAARFCAKFLAGGGGYALLEMLWRGYTHLSMFLLGGLCFLILLRIYRLRVGFSLRCLVGGCAISAAELVAGCIVNLWLGLDVWDYSAERFNAWGQICPRFVFLWCALCAILFGAMTLAGAVAEKRKSIPRAVK